MRKILPLIFMSIFIGGCGFMTHDPNEIKTISKTIDSLTNVRDSLLVESKKLDSPVIFFYYTRRITDQGIGIIRSSEIYHAGDFITGEFEDSTDGETVIEIISEGNRVKKYKP